jgi:DNA-damage-inducible protein D
MCRDTIVCGNSGSEPTGHFREVTKMICSGCGSGRNAIDFRLSRYACYLIVQNGDPRKEMIAKKNEMPDE